MTKALLALHVIAAILAVGPVSVAASMFPAAARRAASEPTRRTQLTLLHRICTVYAVIGVTVPIFGFATAASLHVLGSPWLVASMALTATAALVLAAVILPAQQQLLADPAADATSDADATPVATDPDPAVAAATAAATAMAAAAATTVNTTTTTTTTVTTPDRALCSRLAAYTGTFNLLWATVTVLMILRPGSTTGA